MLIYKLTAREYKKKINFQTKEKIMLEYQNYRNNNSSDLAQYFMELNEYSSFAQDILDQFDFENLAYNNKRLNFNLSSKKNSFTPLMLSTIKYGNIFKQAIISARLMNKFNNNKAYYASSLIYEQEIAHYRKKAICIHCEEMYTPILGACCMECCNCENIYNTSDMQEHDGDFYCQDCHNDLFMICDECGEYHEHENSFYDEITESHYCEACYDKNFHTCENCLNNRHERNMRDISDHVYTWICNNCIQEYYILCDDCGNWHHTEHCYYDDDTDRHLCQSCYDDNQENDQDKLIHCYSYKPEPIFHKIKNENLFFGVELEYNFDNRRKSLEYVNNNLAHIFYCKEDGSLSSEGYEAVSYPASLEFWQTQRKNISNYFSDLKNNDVSLNDCGLHIHISRETMTELHQCRLALFFAENEEKISTIARRSSDQWASFKKRDKYNNIKDLPKNYESRYRALNWQGKDTVECRIFKSTYNSNNFYSALEFCHAIYTFTKSYISIASIDNGKAWNMFSNFVKNHKEYATLWAFMVKKGIA